MLPILEFIDENVIGGKTKFEGPYGEKRGKILDFFCKEGGDNRKNVKLAEVKLKFRSDSNKQNITIVPIIKIRIAQMNPTVD